MEWFSYLLKVSACSAFFYAFYHFFLQKLTFFSSNRYYLLITLALSFLIPVLQLEIKRNRVTEQGQETYTAASSMDKNVSFTTSGESDPVKVVSFNYSWIKILYILYWFIAAVILLQFIYQCLQLFRHIRKVSKVSGHLKLVYKPDGFTNCSFFNYVFVDKEGLTDEEIFAILKHENVHVSKFHSIDKLVVACFKVILWFNPIIYLYSKALEQVHEFEADKETSSIIGNTNYASLLLNIAVRKSNGTLVHSFAQNPLKERIKMLFINPSKKMKKLTYLLILPVGLGLVWLFGVQVVYASARYKTEIGLKSNPIYIGTGVQNTSPMPSRLTNVTENLKKELSVGRANDTLRLIGRDLGKNPKVTIDGRNYSPVILTKISPRCIKSTSGSGTAIDIKTRSNKIEYASKIDIENVRTTIKNEKREDFYIRYSLKNENGGTYDFARIKLKGSMASIDVTKGAKILFIINGKRYSEEEAKFLDPTVIGDKNIISATCDGAMAIDHPELSKEYEGLFQIR